MLPSHNRFPYSPDRLPAGLHLAGGQAARGLRRALRRALRLWQRPRAALFPGPPATPTATTGAGANTGTGWAAGASWSCSTSSRPAALGPPQHRMLRPLPRSRRRLPRARRRDRRPWAHQLRTPERHGRSSEERALIAEATEAIRTHEGKRPGGWMSPGAHPSANTEDLLAGGGLPLYPRLADRRPAGVDEDRSWAAAQRALSARGQRRADDRPP